MTIYADARKVTLVEANLNENRVTVQYHDDEFDEETTAVAHKDALSERHRDPFDFAVSQLRADGGLDEITEAIASLDSENVHGEADWMNISAD